MRPDINITGVIGKTLILEFKGKSMVLSQDEQAEFGLIYSIEPDSVIVQVKDDLFTNKLVVVGERTFLYKFVTKGENLSFEFAGC